jgi:hypothetical protein
MLEHLITEFTEKLHLPLNLEKNTEGYYAVSLNDTTELLFKDLKPGLTCKSVLGALPIEGSLEDLYILLMKANFLGQGTKQGAIAIDDNIKTLIFTLSIPEELNYRLFKEVIEDFVNYLDYWKKRIFHEKKWK